MGKVCQALLLPLDPEAHLAQGSVQRAAQEGSVGAGEAPNPGDPSLCRECWEKWEEPQVTGNCCTYSAFFGSSSSEKWTMAHASSVPWGRDRMPRRTSPFYNAPFPILAEDGTHFMDPSKLQARAFSAAFFPPTSARLVERRLAVEVSVREQLQELAGLFQCLSWHARALVINQL